MRLVDDTLLPVKMDADVRVLYVPPQPGQDAPALREARAVFTDLGVVAGPLEDAEATAVAAREHLIDSGVMHR